MQNQGPLWNISKIKIGLFEDYDSMHSSGIVYISKKRSSMSFFFIDCLRFALQSEGFLQNTVIFAKNKFLHL